MKNSEVGCCEVDFKSGGPSQSRISPLEVGCGEVGGGSSCGSPNLGSYSVS